MEKKKYEKPQVSRASLEKELFEANRELFEANKKLKKEEKLRTEFLSNLSHDLRSPLSALKSSVEYLKTINEGREEEMEIYQLMERRMSSMEILINDIFLLTKVEDPSLVLEKQEVDAEIFLEEFFCDQLANDKYNDRELILDIKGPLNITVNIDPERMLRVLENLFSNALKYSEAGDKIILHAVKDEGYLKITVEDTGIGINEEYLESIFDRFFRISKSRTTGDSSSGLGLPIAKGIILKHGGSIICESTEGVGSNFIIKLPY